MTNKRGEGMLDAQSPVPLYHQLKVALQRSIDQGVWQPGQAIPPERELIAQYGVSRITVRQALSELVAEGLLYRQHGRGTFVAPHRTAPIAETLTELTGHIEELELRGIACEHEVLALESGPLPDEVAEALERPHGAEGAFLYRRVRVDGTPLMLSEVYLPADLQLPPLTGELVEHGLFRVLTAYGHVPATGHQRIGARGASDEEARLLQIEPGEAVLRVCRLIRGSGGLPLVWFRTVYRSDRYEYEVELKRRR